MTLAFLPPLCSVLTLTLRWGTFPLGSLLRAAWRGEGEGEERGGGGGGEGRGRGRRGEGERGGGYWWPLQSHMHRQHTCFRTLDTVNFLNGAARAPEGPSTLTHSLTHTHC